MGEHPHRAVTPPRASFSVRWFVWILKPQYVAISMLQNHLGLGVVGVMEKNEIGLLLIVFETG